jgi:hypothetical protein
MYAGTKVRTIQVGLLARSDRAVCAIKRINSLAQTDLFQCHTLSTARRLYLFFLRQKSFNFVRTSSETFLDFERFARFTSRSSSRFQLL